MGFTASKQAGCALAALLAGDRALEHARAALAPEVAGSVRALLAPRSEARGGQVTALLARVRPQLRALPPGLPPRLSALLAPRMARGTALPLLASAPASRGDFSLDEALLPRLLRIARSEATRSSS